MDKRILRPTKEPSSFTHTYWCPGCKEAHGVNIITDPSNQQQLDRRNKNKGPYWDFTGTLDNPTISPSIRVQGGPNNKVCHFYIRNGHIQYLNDCTHELKGTTTKMQPF